MVVVSTKVKAVPAHYYMQINLCLEGKLRGEARVSARVDPEVRRRDVGQQRYGEGVPKFNSHSTDVFGNISKEKPRLEFKETSHARAESGDVRYVT